MEMKLALILIFALIGIAQSKQEKQETELELELRKQGKLIHNFRLINEHLEKHIKSNDIDQIVAEAKRKMKKLSFFRSNSLNEAYKIFVGLPEMVETGNCSSEAAEIFRNNDIGIDDGYLDPNHKLRPIDLVAQHYGYKFITFCPLAYQIKTKFIFKENKYQQLDKLIVNPGSIEDLNDLFKSYEEDNKDGAMTDALRNILSLKQLLNSDTCDSDIAYHILLKNDLACSRIHYVSPKAFEQMVDYYTKEHAVICRPNYPVKFDSMMQEIDTDLLKTLLLITKRFFQKSNINLDFDTDSIGNYEDLKSKLQEQTNLEIIYKNGDLIYQSKFDFSLRDFDYYANLRLFAVDEPREESFERNLLEPCRKFLKHSDGLIRRLQYDAKSLQRYYGSSEADLKPWVGVFFFRPAYRTCKELENYHGFTAGGVLKSGQSYLLGDRIL